MRARLRRQSLDAIEINDHKPGKSRQRERIKGLFALHARKITQAQRAQLELFSFFRGRQKNVVHLAIITGTFGVRRQTQRAAALVGSTIVAKEPSMPAHAKSYYRLRDFAAGE
jgi:hypothetical protein